MTQTMLVETTDICLAASLRLHGYPLDSIRREDRRGTFVFLDVDVDLVTKYTLGQLLVEPNAFNGAIKFLTMAVKRV